MLNFPRRAGGEVPSHTRGLVAVTTARRLTRWYVAKDTQVEVVSAGEVDCLSNGHRLKGALCYEKTTHDTMIRYRHLAEASPGGEAPVYKELYDLLSDPNEPSNLIDNLQRAGELTQLRKVWKQELTQARGTGFPKVLRHTEESNINR